MPFHPRTRVLLAKAGLAPEELAALGHPARHQMPYEPQGFGLIGDPGRGKSWALVQHLAQRVERLVRAQPDPHRATLLWVDDAVGVARDGRLAWVNWKRQAEDIQLRRFESAWLDSWAEFASDVPVLVLDDLGLESLDGASCPARKLLVRVIEHRYRQRMLLFWTSNRHRGELTDFYGGPLASRLLGTWPDYPVDGQDMRLFPVVLKMAAGGK